jgi:hypothetical protein
MTPNGDHGDSRLDGGDERGCDIFRCPSTLLGVTESEEAGFAGFTGVAHQEFVERLIAEHDDDAVSLTSRQ